MLPGTSAAGGDRGEHRRFAVILTLTFIVVVGVGMTFHELWRDEWQAWLFARDSRTLPGLLHSTRYEGHPAAWHVLLFGLSRFTRSAVAMQVLHLAIAAAAIWTLAVHSPFSRVQKALLAFGYFTAYEYAVISRSYALGTLALFGACAAWGVRRRSPLPLALWLALLAQTSIYGVILALAIGAAFLADLALERAGRGSVRALVLGGTLVAASIALAVAQARPPQDAPFTGRAAVQESASEAQAARNVALIPVRALLPFPRFAGGAPVWGETLLVEQGVLPNTPVLGIVMGLALLAFVARRPAALVFLAAGATGMLLFAFRYHYGYLRHQGQLMLVVVAAFWLARLPGRELSPRIAGERVWQRARTSADVLFTVLLAVHTVTFATMYLAELRLPFSPARSAARVLESAGATRGVPVAATNSPYATSLAGYLDAPVHFLDTGTTGTFVLWSWTRERVPPDSAVARAARLLGPGVSGVLLVTDAALPASAAAAGVRIEPLPIDTRPHLAPEDFSLYRITRSAGVARF